MNIRRPLVLLVLAFLTLPALGDPPSLDDEDKVTKQTWIVALPDLGRLKTHGGASADGLEAIERDAGYIRGNRAKILGEGNHPDAWLLHSASYTFALLNRLHGTRGQGDTFDHYYAQTLADLTGSDKNLRQAAALALVLFEGGNAHPRALRIVTEELLTHTRPMVRVKAALALLCNRPTDAYLQTFRDLWPKLTADERNYLVLLVLKIADRLPTRVNLLVADLYFGQQDLPREPSVVVVLRRESDLREFSELLKARRPLMAAVKVAHVEGISAISDGAPKPEQLGDEVILDRKFGLIGAALHVVATTPATKRDDVVYKVARRIVEHQAVAYRRFTNTAMRAFQAEELQRQAILRATFRAAFLPLLDDSRAEMRVQAALTLLYRDLDTDKVTPSSEPINALARELDDPERFRALPTDVVVDLLEEVEMRHLTQAGLLDRPSIQVAILSRGLKEKALFPRALKLITRQTPEKTLAFLHRVNLEALYVEWEAAAKGAGKNDHDLQFAPRGILSLPMYAVFDHRPDVTSPIHRAGLEYVTDLLKKTESTPLARVLRLCLAVAGDYDSVGQRVFLINYIETQKPKFEKDQRLTLAFQPELAKLPGWHLAALALALGQMTHDFEMHATMPFLVRSLAGDTNGDAYKLAFHALVYEAALYQNSSGFLYGRATEMVRGYPELHRLGDRRGAPFLIARHATKALSPIHSGCRDIVAGQSLLDQTYPDDGVLLIQPKS